MILKEKIFLKVFLSADWTGGLRKVRRGHMSRITVTRRGWAYRGQGWSTSGRGKGSYKRPREQVTAQHGKNPEKVSLVGI